MNKLMILAALLLVGFQSAQAQDTKVEPEFDKPYISVYGSDTCWYTQRMRKDLTAANVPFNYYLVEDQAVKGKLNRRMWAAGIPTKRINLPVVDVNGTLSVRPESAEVLAQFQGE